MKKISKLNFGWDAEFRLPIYRANEMNVSSKYFVLGVQVIYSHFCQPNETRFMHEDSRTNNLFSFFHFILEGARLEPCIWDLHLGKKAEEDSND